MRNHQEPPTCSLRVNREEWSKNEQPPRSSCCQRVNREEWSKNEPPHLCTKVFLQLIIVHWCPLCWRIPLALEWGFYLAQVESYSRLKNAWRATMGGGNQRS